MKISRTIHALSYCIVAELLTACAGTQPPLVAPTLQQNAREGGNNERSQPVAPSYKATSPLLYVASYAETLEPLAVYNPKVDDPGPLATISKDIDNSTGVCIDDDGTLYVTNEASPGWVSEYALGKTKPMRLITKGINTPAFCAIDASGNLWVTNIGFDDVAEYLKGSTNPHTTITKGLTFPDGIAFDHAGNMYVGNPNFGSTPLSNIQVYARGSKTPSRTITEGVTWPVGIAIDAHDTLYVTNGSESGSIEEYRSGQSTPYRTITDELVYPVDITVNKKGWLYVSNQGKYSDETAILEFAPGSLKPSARKITKGFLNPEGLAYYPPVLP
jgi:hypothetical protein